MKEIEKSEDSRRRERSKKTRERKVRVMKGVLLIAGCGILAATVSIGNGALHLEGGSVYALDDKTEIVTADGIPVDSIPAGLQGVITGVSSSPTPGSKVNNIGTTGDNIVVGQRVRTIGNASSDIDVSGSMIEQAAKMNEESVTMAANATMMSDSDYSTLLRIVEAEAGDGDVKARVLVANVILNRIARPDFPDNVTDVVFQYVNGVPQFAPTYDGAFYTVEVTDDTREAVKQALSGTDYSEGALFFVMKSALDESSVSWFDTDLKHLFKYGLHDYYTYPEETDPLNTGFEDQEVLTMASAKEE